MLNEKVDSINESKSCYLLENNEIFPYIGNVFKNLNQINSNLLSVEEDKDLKNKIVQPFYSINNKEENLNRNKGIYTEIKEKENKITYNKNDNQYDFLYKIVENNEGKAPVLYFFENILNIFKKEENKNKFNEIIKIYNNNEEKKDQFYLLDKRTEISIDEENKHKSDLICNKFENKNTEQNTIEKKRGRKTNEIKNRGIHNKKVPDNIIKKIKAKIFEYSIIFLNNVIGNKKADDKLFKLDYQIINRLNKEQDLKYLDMKLKELFSKEISPKYITKERQRDFNKKYIAKLLKYQSDINILFTFNITFRDWLDIFTLKKNIVDIVFKYDYLDKDIDYERIQKSFYGVDNLLNKVMSENNKEYLTMFIFLLYNYERWFYNKKGRKARIKRK